MIWILDTCALSWVRQIPRVGKKGEVEVFEQLTSMLEADLIVFPSQVVDELEERGHDDPEYRPFHWAREHKKQACRFGHLFGEVTEVLAHQQIRRICEWDKAKGADPADPHILALATHLRDSGQAVTVVSEDRVDKARKLSVATACGLLQVFWLRTEPFLVDQDIIPPVDE